MTPIQKHHWDRVAEAHGGVLKPDGKTVWIDLSRKPKGLRSAKAYIAYADSLVDLLALAGRGGAGFRLHVGHSGRGRYLVTDT